MAILGIDHVQVAIPPGGEKRARWFYGELLGLPEVAKPETLAGRGGCWFQCGPQQVHCGVEAEIAPTRRHPAFLTDGLAALRERLAANGIVTSEDAPLPGFARFYAVDPFGNRLELLEVIASEEECYDRGEMSNYRDYTGWSQERIAADLAELQRRRESQDGRAQAERALASIKRARELILARTGGAGIPDAWIEESLAEPEDD